MTRLQFVKPSFRRLLWSTVAVAFAGCLIAGSALFVDALVVSSDDPIPTSTGDYIRLYFVAIMLWGPSLLLIVWFIALPLIVVLGVVMAGISRHDERGSGKPTPTGR